MPSAKIEQDLVGLGQEVERFKEDVTVLKVQLAGLEQENLRSPILVQKLGRFFGFGAAGKLDWVHFKLSYKQEELDRCLTEQARLNGLANGSEVAPELQAASPADFSR